MFKITFDKRKLKTVISQHVTFINTILQSLKDTQWLTEQGQKDNAMNKEKKEHENNAMVKRERPNSQHNHHNIKDKHTT
jgi:hypothetical protein